MTSKRKPQLKNAKTKPDSVSVGNITDSTGVAIGTNAQAYVAQSSGVTADEIATAFVAVMKAVRAMPEGSRKEDAQELVQKLEAEARLGDRADKNRVQRWLAFLAETSADAWEVAIDTFTNPIKGLSSVFQKIAKRAKQDKLS